MGSCRATDLFNQRVIRLRRACHEGEVGLRAQRTGTKSSRLSYATASRFRGFATSRILGTRFSDAGFMGMQFLNTRVLFQSRQRRHAIAWDFKSQVIRPASRQSRERDGMRAQRSGFRALMLTTLPYNAHPSLGTVARPYSNVFVHALASVARQPIAQYQRRPCGVRSRPRLETAVACGLGLNEKSIGRSGQCSRDDQVVTCRI
jgi:hypothetical protein